MKVLFIYPNITDYPIDISFGIAALSSYLKSYDIEVSLVDLTFHSKLSLLDKHISGSNPDLIGIPVASNDFEYCRKIADYIKKRYKIPIVAGGYHATMAPADVLTGSSFDYVITGEGEKSLMQLIEYLVSDLHPDKLRKIPGICFRDQDQLVCIPPGKRTQHLEIFPFPDRKLFDYQKYVSINRGLATFISSYGCPYSCTYCINKALTKKFGKEGFVRFKPISYLLREIQAVIDEFNVREIEFYDDTFTLNRQRLMEFCDSYPVKIGLPFYINSRVDTLSKSDFPMLKKAGCKRISFGIECGDPFVRNEILKRDQTDEQIIAAFRHARDAGIQTLSYNMVGIPYETNESVKKTIDLNRKCKPDYIAVSIFNAYMGTELYDHCKEKGWLKETRGLSYFQTSNIMHPNFSLNELKKFRDRLGYEVFREVNYKRALIDLVDKTLIENRFYQLGRSFMIKQGIKKYL